MNVGWKCSEGTHKKKKNKTLQLSKAILINPHHKGPTVHNTMSFKASMLVDTEEPR